MNYGVAHSDYCSIRPKPEPGEPVEWGRDRCGVVGCAAVVSRESAEDLLASVCYWQEAWLRTSLYEFFRSAEYVGMWLYAPDKHFDGRRPVDLLGTPDFDKVVEVVDQLVSGGNG